MALKTNNMLVLKEKHRKLHQFLLTIDGQPHVICEVVYGHGKNNIAKLVCSDQKLNGPQQFLVDYSVEKVCRILIDKYTHRTNAQICLELCNDLVDLIGLNKQFFPIVQKFVADLYE